jgi:hypothetical protein
MDRTSRLQQTIEGLEAKARAFQTVTRDLRGQNGQVHCCTGCYVSQAWHLTRLPSQMRTHLEEKSQLVQQTEDENRFLRYKVELLIDMLAVSSLDSDELHTADRLDV